MTATMRGYFGIGAEGISKSMNVGSIYRSAHAFGASFVFSVASVYARGEGERADTSNSQRHLPYYSFPDIGSMILPEDCQLVGIELTDDAIDLPSFRHPPRAAYVLGPERGNLTDDMIDRCDFVIKIPTRFCINVGIAAAVVMYDRVNNLGSWPARPVRPGGPVETAKPHVYGDQVMRKKLEKFKQTPPLKIASED